MLFLIGCSTKVRDINYYFENTPSFCEKVNKIDIQNAVFGMPLEVVIHDTILIVIDRFQNYHFSLIDIKNRKLITRFGKEGRGPKEILSPSNLNINYAKAELEFSDITDRYITISLDNLNNKDFSLRFSTQNLDIKRNNVQNSIWFPAINKHIANGMFIQGKYAIINTDGVITDYWGSLPNSPYLNSIDNFTLCDAYQGIIKSRPDGTMIAQASLTCDLIDVINAKGDISRFQTYDPEIKLIDGIIATSRNSPYGFRSLSVTDNYIYALYSGRSFNEYQMAAQFCEILFVFDWNLVPVCSYNLPVETLSLAASPCDSKLYCIGMGETQMELYELTLQH